MRVWMMISKIQLMVCVVQGYIEVKVPDLQTMETTSLWLLFRS